MKRLTLTAVSFLAVVALMWAWLGGEDAPPPPVPVEAKPAPAVRAPVPAPVLPAVRSGSVEGRVVRQGSPAAGARVTLRATTARVVQAGADGTFAFDDVPPGELWASAALDDEASPVTGPLVLGPGERRTGVVLELHPGAAVSGQVVDSQSREPIGGAQLVTSGGAGVTDGNGRFVLRGLPPGQTWIEASAKGHLPRVEWLTLDAAKPHSGLEISLDPSSSIAGTVHQQGRPMAGAQVWAERLIGARVGYSHGPVTTGADGTYRLEVGPGLLRVQGQVPDGTRIQGPRLRIEAGEDKTGVDLEAGESLGVGGQVRLDGAGLPAAALTLFDVRTSEVAAMTTSGGDGKFRFERVPVGSYLVQVRRGALTAQTGPFDQTGEGQEWIVDLSGASVLSGRVVPAAAGVRVQWRSGDWAGAAAETTTDATGAFRFEGVASGVLLVEAEGEAGSAAARAAAGTKDLVLTLARGRLKVFVQDERGGAISDFALTLVPQSGGLVRRFPVLSPTGIFTLDLPAGIWRVEASAAGYTDGPPQMVEVRGPEAEARLMLAKGGPVKGTVRDAASRLPIRGASVTLIRLAGPPGQQFRNLGRVSAGQTDGNGEFYAPAVSLPTTIEVRHPLYVTAWHSVPAVRDGTARLDILLQPGKPQAQGDRFIEYEGVGMQLQSDGKRVWISMVYENSPAEAAGLAAGDVIQSVNDQPVALPVEQAVRQITGPAGSVVKIVVQRGAEALEFSIRRRAITL